ncbi:MAG: hypothetical protein JSW06_11325 [Thermoplasmatales archaeon]|nr:MAG: hypothetical protein JSW06_11325 [Thermoplasmatales archaeon]
MLSKRRILSIMIIIVLIISMFTNPSIFIPIIQIGKADPGNINESWFNETTLNVTVLQLEPRINWYDFQYNQSGTWVTRLNAQIDVNNSAEYRFIVNISSDQGWDDIEYMNITAWFDNGSEATTYNQTEGGNINLFLQYENTTGNANWTLHWPDNEVSFNSGNCIDTIETDPDGSPGNTECHNLSIPFIPSFQFRYAPGDGAWDTTAGFNDTRSWNFNITVEDQSGYASYNNPILGETIDEFGVYSYTEIVSAGWPTITGNPGSTAIADSNITIETRSNNNYSLSADLDQLNHTSNPTANMPNTTVSLRGGNLTSVTPFPGTGPLYLWGTNGPSYQVAENNGTSLITNNVEYRIAIPLAQLPGDYNATIYYRLITQT